MATVQAPIIPGDWSQPAGCLSAEGIWDWYGSDGALNEYVDVLGAPTDTTCYPPLYTPSGFMSATACPDGFTSACITGSATACCPT